LFCIKKFAVFSDFLRDGTAFSGTKCTKPEGFLSGNQPVSGKEFAKEE